MKFNSFATPTIGAEVRNYLRDKGSILRVSRDTRSRLYRMQKVRESLTQELQREPSMKELAAAMGIAPDELLSLLDQRESSEVMSMSSAASADEDAQELEERLGGSRTGTSRWSRPYGCSGCCVGDAPERYLWKCGLWGDGPEGNRPQPGWEPDAGHRLETRSSRDAGVTEGWQEQM